MEPDNMLESFPFDSSPDLEYDDNGYPRFDRAVGSRVMRDTFKKFFTNGVFPSPADALNISKGDGLNVKIAPGACIIEGAMAAIYEEAMTVQLDTAAPQGTVNYAVMLHMDLNYEQRCISIVVKKSEASAEPEPVAPDQTTPNVYELRLGNITVPNGAGDLSGATVTNEKGTSVCPYAAPFEDLDMEAMVLDARAKAEEHLAAFKAELEATNDDYSGLAQVLIDDLRSSVEKNLGLLESAITGTTAGYLQDQINKLKPPESMTNEEIDEVWRLAEPEQTT